MKKSKRVVDDEDIESEDEDEDHTARVFIEADTVGRKRAVSIDGRDEELENEEPAKKKQKVQEVKVKVKPKKPTATKKSKKALKAETIVEEVVFESDTFQSPFVDQLRLGSSSLTPSSRSPTPVAVLRPSTKRKKRVVTPRPPTPPPDPVGCGLCEDDEDIYFTKLALTGEVPAEEKPQVPPTSTDIPTFRKHLTGSARTEGYYKITHAEKAAYVAQYQARAAATIGGAAPPVIDEPKPQHVTSSRSNRANARRRAQGLEEINQVQRAVALSKGETAANELTFKFNQLQTRKKHLRFARSPIHDWGLYAMEKIARGEMVIEYVGEVIRAQVADKREKAYERQGIGSSYLFRIDEDLVVDATKKGNLGYVCFLFV
jgi:histone-lysine N-methyltransferase SETD1